MIPSSNFNSIVLQTAHFLNMGLRALVTRFLFSLFTLTSWLSLFSQDPHPAFKNYEVEAGLPSTYIFNVKQDSKGYIWFATGNGVSRFNGYEFENFSSNGGLLDNIVFNIVEDAFERIWFLPLSCRLSYYYKGKIYLYKYNDTLAHLFKNSPLGTSLYIDKNEDVFLGLRNEGVYQISKDGIIKHYFNEKDSINAGKILEPSQGNFVYTYTRKYSQLNSIEFYTNSAKRKVISPKVFATQYDNFRIIRLKNEKIVVACDNNLYLIDSINQVDTINFPGRIANIYEDRDGDLWVGILNGGVYHVSNSDFKNKKHHLDNKSVTGILQDKEGGFWFSTEGYSVFYSPSKFVLTYNNIPGLNTHKITTLASDGTTLFAGTDNGFVLKIQGTRLLDLINTNEKGHQDNEIFTLKYNSIDKNIWVYGRTKNGFINKSGFTPKKSPAFSDMFAESDTVLWFATSSGLCETKYNKKSSFMSYDLKTQKPLTTLVKSDSNTFFLGSTGGLFKYKIKENTIESENTDSLLIGATIMKLLYTPVDSFLVIATKGKGLLLYKNKKVQQISSKNGLCSDNVNIPYIDSNVIWTPTGKGLSKITILKSSPLKYKLQNYTIADGLAARMIYEVTKMNSHIYAATVKGLCVFNPDHMQQIHYKLPMHITSVTINERDTSIQNFYDLKYNENNIKIKYVALSYKNTGKIKYRYKMLGLDTSWIYTQNREVQFTTLPAEKYTFLLSCQQADGSWDMTPLKIEFNVKKAFWNEWWFYLLTLLLISTLLRYLFKHRVNKIKERERKAVELNKNLLNLKLKALRAQMDPHFTFNVLNSIQHYISDKDELSSNKYLTKFSRLVRAVLNNSEETLIPLSDEIKALELYIDLEAMRCDESFNYEISIENGIDLHKIKIPSMLLQPYVENAIKHGVLPLEKGGKIKIEILKVGEILKCVIEDNGIGRKKSNELRGNEGHKSFGTTITQKRLALISELYGSVLSEKTSDLLDKSGKNLGTRVEIGIPFDMN